MQRFNVERRQVAQRPGAPAPVIAFPPNGARIPVGAEGDPVPLRAAGGVRPLRWMVNGELLPQTDYFASPLFNPDGEGFTEITVIDKEGRSASSTVRFVAQN